MYFLSKGLLPGFWLLSFLAFWPFWVCRPDRRQSSAVVRLPGARPDLAMDAADAHGVFGARQGSHPANLRAERGEQGLAGLAGGLVNSSIPVGFRAISLSCWVQYKVTPGRNLARDISGARNPMFDVSKPRGTLGEGAAKTCCLWHQL